MIIMELFWFAICAFAGGMRRQRMWNENPAGRGGGTTGDIIEQYASFRRLYFMDLFNFEQMEETLEIKAMLVHLLQNQATKTDLTQFQDTMVCWISWWNFYIFIQFLIFSGIYKCQEWIRYILIC